MSSPYIEIWIYARPDRSVSIEERHASFVEKMMQIGPPLGYQGIVPPPTPDCGGGLTAVFSAKYPIRGLKCFGDYIYRGERYVWEDHGSFDEHLRFRFNINNKAIIYSEIIKEQIPLIVDAFDAYRAKIDYDYHEYNYRGGFHKKNEVYNALNAINPENGRNWFYTLYPAQFWDGELCRRALGFGPEEVIRRLKDVAVLAQPLMDGVYLVLNDNPKLTYEEFVDMNERIKPMLGLNYVNRTVFAGGSNF